MKSDSENSRLNYRFTLRLQAREDSLIAPLIVYLQAKPRREVQSLLLKGLNKEWLVACLEEYDKEQINRNEIDDVSQKIITRFANELEGICEILVKRGSLWQINYLTFRLAAINELLKNRGATATQMDDDSALTESDVNDASSCDASISSIMEGPQYKPVDMSNVFNW